MICAKKRAAFPEITPGRRVWMHVRLGEALAHVGGQERAARDAIAHAHEFVSELPDRVDAADLIMSAGGALGRLGVFDDAYSSLDAAVQLSGEQSPLLIADTLTHQAMTAVRAADPEYAADRMSALIRVVPLISSSRMDRKLGELLTLSARWVKVPEIRAAREQLHAITTTRV